MEGELRVMSLYLSFIRNYTKGRNKEDEKDRKDETTNEPDLSPFNESIVTGFIC